MRPLMRSLLFLGQFAVLGLALAFVLIHLAPGMAERLRGAPGGGPGAVPTASETLPAGYGAVSYADAAARAAPAVVNIYANKAVVERPWVFVPDPMLQRFSGITLGPPRTRIEQSLGSGVIVSDDGYVLTNHHVIKDADDIQAVLWDGRVTRARIVGSDRETDLAVLRIEGSGLPALPLRPELPLRVGDVVLAIGNPFGLGNTVTQGIVSALGRNQLNVSTYEDFIQTDAAINQGNSGGALISARGDLVGINTAMLSRYIANAEGIGFAIPVTTARQVLDQIVEHGTVIRGWLGAEYGDAPLLPGGLEPGQPRGVALTAVYPGGPAERAGLRPGDVLLSINQVDINEQGELRRREAEMRPGDSVEVAGLRAGLPFSTELVLAQRPPPRSA